MMKVCIVILFSFCAASAWAVDQVREEYALHLAREIVRALYGFERGTRLPPAANAQVRVIAKKIAAESKADFQPAVFPAEDRKLYRTLMKHAGIGLILCLVIFVVHTVIQKIYDSRDNGKTDLKVAVHNVLRTAPYIRIIPMRSEAEAHRVGRALIAERLAARADIFPQYSLSKNKYAVLFVTTVKGRLKTLDKRLKDLSVSVSFPVLHGHRAYLTHIADAADGRG